MVEAFNDVILTSESQNQHENRPAIQNNFVKDVVNQVSSFEELGIPFMESWRESYRPLQERRHR